MFFHTPKGKAVMRNILGSIRIAMFVASCSGGAAPTLLTMPQKQILRRLTKHPSITRARQITPMVQATQTHRKIPLHLFHLAVQRRQMAIPL